MVERILGAERISATALSEEVGVCQQTLSRWVCEARRIVPMSKKNHNSTPSPDSRRWTAEEKLQAWKHGGDAKWPDRATRTLHPHPHPHPHNRLEARGLRREVLACSPRSSPTPPRFLRPHNHENPHVNSFRGFVWTVNRRAFTSTFTWLVGRRA